MKKIKNANTILIIIAFVSVFCWSCMKSNVKNFDHVAQYAKDSILIQKYLLEHKITGMQRDLSGVYFQILNPGSQPDSGKYIYKNFSHIIVKYNGRVLGATTDFDQGDSVNMFLGNLIPAWKIAILKIQPRGKIHFITPSYWAYRENAQGSIPANSILDFTVELLKVTEN